MIWLSIIISGGKKKTNPVDNFMPMEEAKSLVKTFGLEGV
jgi:hypothetical protein